MIINQILKILPLLFLLFTVAPATTSAQSRGLLAADINYTSDIKGTVGNSLNSAVNSVVQTASNTINATLNASTSVSSSSTSTANLDVNGFGVAITTAADVNSEADLQVWEDNVSKTHENVSKVESTSDNNGNAQIIVSYKHPGRFLGLLPVTYTSKTIVTASSSGPVVTSKLSLWSNLITEKTFDNTDVEAKISNDPVVKGNIGANMTARAKAKVAEEVIWELDASEAKSANVNQ